MLLGELEPDLANVVLRTQPEQDFLGFSGAELAAQTSGGEFGQQAVEPTDRLGAR